MQWFFQRLYQSSVLKRVFIPDGIWSLWPKATLADADHAHRGVEIPSLRMFGQLAQVATG